MLASANGHESCISLLLSNGANIHDKDKVRTIYHHLTINVLMIDIVQLMYNTCIIIC